MESYETLSAQHRTAERAYEAARAAKDAAYLTYIEACRALSACIETELAGWSPASLTTHDTAAPYGVVCIVSAP